MPTSLVHNWLSEIEKFTTGLSASAYVGTDRKPFKELYCHSDIIVTTYGIVRNDFDIIKHHEFLYLILDESQVIKNPESKTYKAAIKLSALHRLVLTGTPIENSLTDLWSQMNFLNKGLLGNFQYFKANFVQPIETKGDVAQKRKLLQLIQPFMLRRTKQQVAKDLPDLTEQAIYCEMSEMQEKYYEEEKSKIRNVILET
ncbi:MAG: hypothetical protein HC896_06955 [Bacteroidales bacterium]|nr:hypothetical protein [Bacteroidales bacterium]